MRRGNFVYIMHNREQEEQRIQIQVPPPREEGDDEGQLTCFVDAEGAINGGERCPSGKEQRSSTFWDSSAGTVALEQRNRAVVLYPRGPAGGLLEKNAKSGF